jgi:hypothetical protein
MALLRIGRKRMKLRHATLLAFLALALSTSLPAAPASRVHGLWVWKGPAILRDGRDDQRLIEFCRAHAITEVYLAISSHHVMMTDRRITEVINRLHGGDIRVETLLSSEDADEPGRHRDKLLQQVDTVVQFNRRTPGSRFDGIHLDVEPQQRMENKGSGNLGFVANLVETYRAVRARAEREGLTVNADIQMKLLKGSADERRALFGSLPRLTLMMYELSAADAKDETARVAQVQAAGQKYLSMAYADIDNGSLAKLAIGLRTPDYGDALPRMLQALEAANAGNPNFLGWAEHSYNDQLAQTASP